ncbi:MAG: peptidylprolyl isomerase [Bacteroidales bacterium]|nr:peptidylprolyl isomerase [Bacteroidales bacterium]
MITTINKIRILIVLFPLLVNAQEKGVVIDQVMAVVGSEIILQSEIELQYFQYRMQQGITGSESSVKCNILENMLYQKLLLNQAGIDSVEVSDVQVESELDRRLRYFIGQFGSQEKFEEFYEKSVIEFKEEFRDQVREQIMVETVQGKITENIKITPSEVREFYKTIPDDSIPFINSEIEIAQIVKMPKVSSDEKNRVMEKLNELRARILKGESFATLAILYSEDPGSARNGGELGLHGRGELYPEFEAVAFRLQKEEVSDIVETKAGYHILQLIERRGEFVNIRHILLRPKVSPFDLAKAKVELDSIAGMIDQGKYTFEEAVTEFSDDPGKVNKGLILNPVTGNTLFEADHLDPKVFFVVDKLEVGEISIPVQFETEEGTGAYRLLYLSKRTDPHKANLKDDYSRIQEWALDEKEARAVQKWIREKASNTFVRIADEYRTCEFADGWLSKNTD